MKKFVVVAVAAVAAAAVVAAFFAFPALFSRDAAAILQSAAAKLANVTEYGIDYSITNSIAVGEDSMNMTGAMSILRKGAAEKTVMRFRMMGQTIAVEVYSVPNGSYSCQAGFGGVVCERFNGSLPAPSPIAQAASLLSLESQGIVTASAEWRQPASRLPGSCSGVLFDYDVKKIIANASLPEEFGEGIEQMSAYVCFDDETGIPLDFEQSVRLSAETTATSVMRMTATRLELAAPDIVLPENATIY